MFPETFVRRNVQAWSRPGDLILDPFCGRGTTVFESLLNGRRAIGCDTNPVAYCISRAKATPPTLVDVQARITALESTFRTLKTRTAADEGEFFALCFHDETLRQLRFMMKALKWREDATDCFIAALTLGCLHGESHKSGWCLSNRMPRTISTKPAYSVRWWRKHRCAPPNRDVFAILRAIACYRYESPLPVLRGRVVEGDVRRAATLLRSYRDKVKLVITSPPYIDITDYHEDQWLRLWFLGGAAKPITNQGKDDRHRGPATYWQFLREAWGGVVPLLQDSAQVVIRIGGTRLGAEELRTELLNSLNSTGRRFGFAEARQTIIKNGQRRIFRTAPDKTSVEHDFRFKLA